MISTDRSIHLRLYISRRNRPICRKCRLDLYALGDFICIHPHLVSVSSSHHQFDSRNLHVFVYYSARNGILSVYDCSKQYPFIRHSFTRTFFESWALFLAVAIGMMSFGSVQIPTHHQLATGSCPVHHALRQQHWCFKTNLTHSSVEPYISYIVNMAHLKVLVSLSY